MTLQPPRVGKITFREYRPEDRHLISSKPCVSLGPMLKNPPKNPPAQPKPEEGEQPMTGKQTQEEAFSSRTWKPGDLP